jgi:hypothetical protein
MNGSDRAPVIAGTVLGAVLAAIVGGALAGMGWIDTVGPVVAAQSHAILIFALAISVEDQGVRDGAGQGVAMGLLGVLGYGVALAYGLGIVWGLIMLFGDEGVFAFANQSPALVRWPLEIIVGTLVTALWMVFGFVVFRPLFRDDAPDLLAGGFVSLLMGGILSVIIGLFVFLGGFALGALFHFSWSVAEPGVAAALGGAYGLIQGYVVARAAVS